MKDDMTKILVLGTGSPQKDFIEYCKKSGLYIYAISNASGHAAESLADEFELIDIVDMENVCSFAEGKHVDYIYSVGSDVAMPTAASASAQLSLPCFISADTAKICNHKQLLRQVLDVLPNGNVPYEILQTGSEDITISFPLIMKPTDSQGQRGVYRIDGPADIDKCFRKSLAFSNEKKVILESFVEGDEISVNVFVENGKLKFYIVSDRKAWNEFPGGIIHEHTIPSRYDRNPEISRKIKELVVNVLKQVGIENGPAYFQIKVDREGNPFLIEATPRLDGCHMWRLIKYSTGIDLMKATVDGLMGRPYNQDESFQILPYSLEFLCEKPDAIFDKSKFQVPHHEFLCWYYEDGETVRKTNGYFEKCGYVIKRGEL